jgi:hypothetical protein
MRTSQGLFHRLPPAACWLLGVLAATACSAGADDVVVRDVPRDEVHDDAGATCDPGCTDTDGGVELTCCANGCVDLHSDLFNCGECDNECALDEICQAGICFTPDCMPECLDVQLCCGDNECIDPMSDNLNCGECGNVCDAPYGCVGGVCQCGSGATARVCTPDQECCAGSCVNLESDANNCGACGASCGGEPCNGGQCTCGSSTCPTGQTCCDVTTADPYCADLSSDMEHCGGCNTTCDSERSTGCVAGQCLCGSIEQCPSGTSMYPLCHDWPVTPPHRCCGGECVRIDDFSCSRCGQRCMAGTECTPSVGVFSCTFSCQVPSG